MKLAFSLTNLKIFAISLGLAIGVTVAPEGSFDILSSNIKLVVTDGIVLGAIVALILNQLLPQEKK